MYCEGSRMARWSTHEEENYDRHLRTPFAGGYLYNFTREILTESYY